MTGPGCYLETLSWDEAEGLLAAAPIVLLPLGARLKEHGLHLPLNNDWLLAEYLTSRVMAEVPVVVLPTLPFHYYPAFVEYPGSVTLQLETSQAMVMDVCRSITRFGPTRFYVLNTGVSTVQALQPAAEALAEDGVILRFTDLLAALRPVEAELSEQEGGTHADEMETSMMLYVAPHVVRLHRAVPDFHPSKGPGPLTRNPRAETGVYSPTGAWGDPTLATLDKGRRSVEALVQYLVADIRRLMGTEPAGELGRAPAGE